MADAFVSYAREERDFVRRLKDDLNARGRETWVDWAGIEPSDDWWQSVVEAIDAADAFVFVLSPASLESTTCRAELDHAVAEHKRLIVVLRRPVGEREVPATLAAVNWVPLRDQDDFAAGLEAVDRALALDLDLVRVHTRVLTRAKAWELGGRRRALLLVGPELRAAQGWLERAAAGFEPQPTEAQALFVVESRLASRRRQKLTLVASVAIASVAVGLAVFALIQRSQARQQSQVSRSRELAAEAEQERVANPEDSIMLAAEGIRAARTRQAIHALSDALEASRLRVDLRQGSPAGPVAFSPTGDRIASGGGDGSVRLWRIADRRIIWAGEPDAAQVAGIVFSHSGDVLVVSRRASVSNQTNCAVQVLSASTGAVQRTLEAGSQSTDCTPFVSFVGSTRTVAVADRTGDIRFLDVDTGRGMGTLHGLAPPGGVDYTLAFSADGRQIAAAGTDSLIRIVSLPDGRPIATLQGTSRSHFTTVAFSPDNTQLAVAEALGPTYVEDIRTHAPRVDLQATFASGVTTAWSPDGRLIVGASPHGEIYVWHGGSDRLIETLHSPSGQVSLAVAFSADGRLATGAQDGSIRVWAPDPDVPLRDVAGAGSTNYPFAAYASTVHLAAIGDGSGQVLITDDAGREIARLRLHGDGPFAMARNGNLVFRSNGRLYVTNVLTRQVVRSWDAPSLKTPDQVAVSGDGRLAAIASVTDTGALTVFSAGSRRTTSFQVQASYAPVTSLSLSWDGALVAVATRSGVSVFRTSDLRLVHREPGTAVRFAAAGRLVAIVRPDISIAIVRTDTWGQQTLVRGDPSGQLYLDFSPDSRLLATTGYDGVLRVWDATDGSLIRTRYVFEAAPVSDSTLAMSPPVVTGSGFVLAGALITGSIGAFDVCSHCLDASALLAEATLRLHAVQPSGTR